MVRAETDMSKRSRRVKKLWRHQRKPGQSLKTWASAITTGFYADVMHWGLAKSPPITHLPF